MFNFKIDILIVALYIICIIPLHRRFLVRIHIQEIKSFFEFKREEKCSRAPTPARQDLQVKPVTPVPPTPTTGNVTNVSQEPQGSKIPVPIQAPPICPIPTAASASAASASTASASTAAAVHPGDNHSPAK